MGWFRKQVDEPVSPTSPAVLLAKSLTEPETRGEWVRTREARGLGISTTYANKKRKLEVSVWFFSASYGSSSGIATPFTLNSAEEAVVKKAVIQVERYLRAEDERAALARLVRS